MQRATVSGCGPEAPEAAPGKEAVQGRLLSCAAPALYTARLFGLAPFRLVRATAQREACVLPCPFWAAYSTLLLLCLCVLLGAVNYLVVVSGLRRSETVSTDYMLLGLRSVMAVVAFVKQAVAVSLTALAVLRGGHVARVLEKLVRIAGRLGVSARWLRGARWVVAAQVALMAAWLGWLAVRAYSMNPVALVEAPCLPALYFVNMQFTDAALLLRRELQALNESVEALCEARRAWDAPSSFLAHLSKSTVAWVDAPPRPKSGGDCRRLVNAARGAQRELRRAFLQLDEAFALQNLAFIMVAFVQTTVVLYAVMVEGLFVWTATATMTVLMLQLLVTLSACQSTTDESRRTAVAVHRVLLRPDLSEATRAELVDFSVALLSAEMRFSAWGFFPMDYALLQAFVGTVVTYIVIMVQFRSPKAQAAANATTVASLLSTTTS